MTSLLSSVMVTLILVAMCHARAANYESSDLAQAPNFHPAVDDSDEDVDVGSKFRPVPDEAHLMRLMDEVLALRSKLLTPVSHYSDEMGKRFKPSGFLGSRGKRFIPGLESLLLASYYQDAEKWKRQPHLGFHGSRG